MLQSLYSLGQFRVHTSSAKGSSVNSDAREESIKNALDNLPKPKGQKKQLVAYIKLLKDNNGYSYAGVGFDELDPLKTVRYLYKKGSPNGGDQTFISKITDIEKTFNRVFIPFDKVIEYYKNSDTELTEIEKIRKGLSASHDLLEKIKNEVKNEVSASVGSENQCEFLTFKIFENAPVEKSYYINELPSVVDYFYETCVANDDKKYEHSAEEKSCCVCHKIGKVFGKKAFPFSFYTIDKPGLITGGFDEAKSWKNLPICGQCADMMSVGQKMAEENLRFSLCGQSYLLIPDFHNERSQNEILEKLCEQSKKLSIADRKNYNEFIALEEDIFELLGNSSDYINSSLLFFEKQNSAFRILLLIEDVLPSRFKKLYLAKLRITKWAKCYRNDKDFNFNFKTVKNYFYRNKDFFEVLSKIFYSKNIDYRLCIRNVMEKVREEFNTKKEKTAYFATMNGLAMLKFFYELELIKNINQNKGDESMEKSAVLSGAIKPGDEYAQKQKSLIEEFFYLNKEFFDNPMKKAIFLLGALAKKLLNIQSRDRNATPFYEHLKGLKMSEKDILGLLPKIQNKLNEYKKNYYQALETIISAYFIESGAKFNMTCDEINFYFTLGMNMHKSISVSNEETDETEGEIK